MLLLRVIRYYRVTEELERFGFSRTTGHEIYALLYFEETRTRAYRILFQSFPKNQIELNHLLIAFVDDQINRIL